MKNDDSYRRSEWSEGDQRGRRCDQKSERFYCESPVVDQLNKPEI